MQEGSEKTTRYFVVAVPDVPANVPNERVKLMLFGGSFRSDYGSARGTVQDAEKFSDGMYLTKERKKK